MADFSGILNDLRAEERTITARLDKIRAAITALVGVGGGARRGRAPGRRGPGRPKGAGKRRGRPKGRKMSAATRARMAAAQRARWAKRKAAK